MFRTLFTASRLVFRPALVNIATPPCQTLLRNCPTLRNFTTVLSQQPTLGPGLLKHPKLLQIAAQVPTRNVIKYSWRKGKRKSVRVVLNRFYRLRWGGWIRTKCGRQKKLWRKSPPRKRRLRQHVLVNSSQANLLDKMVWDYWKKPRYWVDDPYEPYHSREDYQFTYKKPRPYFPPEKEEKK